MSELTEDSVRADVRAWLEANWNPELGLVEWRNKLADSGWGVPTWPKQWYGRDLPQAFQAGPPWLSIPTPALSSIVLSISAARPNRSTLAISLWSTGPDAASLMSLAEWSRASLAKARTWTSSVQSTPRARPFLSISSSISLVSAA